MFFLVIGQQRVGLHQGQHFHELGAPSIVALHFSIGLARVFRQDFSAAPGQEQAHGNRCENKRRDPPAVRKGNGQRGRQHCQRPQHGGQAVPYRSEYIEYITVQHIADDAGLCLFDLGIEGICHGLLQAEGQAFQVTPAEPIQRGKAGNIDEHLQQQEQGKKRDTRRQNPSAVFCRDSTDKAPQQPGDHDLHRGKGRDHCHGGQELPGAGFHRLTKVFEHQLHMYTSFQSHELWGAPP